MDGPGTGGGKVFGRFTEPAHQVLDLARVEAERAGHRYLGPEHVLLGLLAEGHSQAAQLLRSARVELAAARAGLARLADRGVVPAPRPSDGELLGTLGIDLDSVRYQTEQRFGDQAVGEATWRVTRRRWWWGPRVVWTPLCGLPLVAKRALQLASQQAHALGHSEVRPEHLLLGVLEDARQPTDKPTSSRRHRQIIAHVGLPDGYHGAAGPLLAGLQVDLGRLQADLGRLQEAVATELRGMPR
jgi:ATP-dependent Clp protease ATP-binding subunit ClpA